MIISISPHQQGLWGEAVNIFLFLRYVSTDLIKVLPVSSLNQAKTTPSKHANFAYLRSSPDLHGWQKPIQIAAFSMNFSKWIFKKKKNEPV